MNDAGNVSPFPVRPRKPLFDPRDPKSQTYLVYALSIAAFAISWSGGHLMSWIGVGCGIAALAISASKRDEGVFWARSHFDFALRTLIIGGVGWILVGVIGFIPFIGPVTAWALKPVIMLWVLARCVVGAVRASNTKIVTNPTSWLV